MKTRVLVRGSSDFHSRSNFASKSMWTPWKTRRLFEPLDGEHAFHAVDVAAFHAEEFADPVVEFFAVEIAGGADADGGDGVVVLVRGVEIPLPARLRGFAHEVDVQRIVAAGFEDEIETGRGELELVATVALGEEKAVEGRAGGDGFPFLRA